MRVAHWLATGFLASTILFLLLMFSAESSSVWHQKSMLPLSRTERQVRSGLDSIRGSLGGMIGGVLGAPEVSGWQ